jgi:PAS domain S-box-containing protein
MASATEIGRLDTIQGFRIQDDTGAVLAESGDLDLPVGSPDFLVTREIVYASGASKETLGTLTITGYSDYIWRDFNTQIQSLLLGLVVLLLALVGATLLANRIVIGRPIKLLHQSIAEARVEGVSRKVEWQGHDELSQVVSAYNDLLDAQKESEAEIRQYQGSLEQQVNERTEELRKVVQAVEQSPLCVVITDITGKIEHVNPTFTRVTGYESHEVIGKNSRVLKSGETPSEEYDSLWQTILSGKVWQNEIRNRKKSGELYWVSISIAPVKNDEGAVTHFVAMIDDITRAKKAEDELARQRMVLTSIIDTIPDWIFVKDKEGRFQHLNLAQAQDLQRDREELLGTTAFDHFAEENADQFHEQDQQVLQGETRHNSEWILYPDGSRHLMETTKVPFRDNTGKIDGILGISRDMTARHAAEVAHKASLERFRVLFEESSDAHLILVGNQVVECNTAALEMLHCKDKDDLLSRQPSTLSPELQPDGRRSAEKAAEMDAIAREQGSHRFDWIHRRVDGEDFPVQVTLTHITMDGQPAVLGVWNDLSEHKAVEEALEKAKQAADAANQAKSEFLANMSHELRTPMNAVLGYSEMLIEEAEDVGQDDIIPDLKRINQAGNHLLSLIDDVLDLSKIESGKMEVFAEIFDVGDLIDQIAGTAEPLMTKNNNHFRIERGDNLGEACQDITKLQQSLLNLLSNAAKFTLQGTITLRVEREQTDEGEWLVLT